MAPINQTEARLAQLLKLAESPDGTFYDERTGRLTEIFYGVPSAPTEKFLTMVQRFPRMPRIPPPLEFHYQVPSSSILNDKHGCYLGVPSRVCASIERSEQAIGHIFKVVKSTMN